MNIVVLAGGLSTERDVSFKSGYMVAEALRRKGHKALLLDVFMGYGEPGDDVSNIFDKAEECSVEISAITGTAPDIEAVKKSRKDQSSNYFGPNVIKLCRMADVVFMALHGADGENGKVQAAFDMFGIIYTGNGYLSSALAMDKAVTKKFLSNSGIPFPEGDTLTRTEWHKKEIKVPFPRVVKPACGGSSIGVSIVENEADYEEALKSAFELEECVVIEEYIKGREFSCGVMRGKALPVIEIAPIEGFYDYKNKYKAGSAVETCPADLPEEKSSEMQHYAEMVMEGLGLNAYARMDFLMNEDGRLYCLEANTLPGMTPTSLLPQEAAAVGMGFDDLCEEIIHIALEAKQS